MSNRRLLIRNGFVLSMDSDVGDIPHADVYIEDGTIAKIGQDLAIEDAEQVDASGMIVMPGFIDTHRHLWQTAVRGLLPSCTMDEYGAVMIARLGREFRPEDVANGNYAAALEGLNAGITTLLDWSHISITPEHSDAAIQALKESGIRAVYAHGPPPGVEWYAASGLEHPADIRRIRRELLASDDGLVTLAMAARPPGQVTNDVLMHDWLLARELDLRISVHVVHVGRQFSAFNVNHVRLLNERGLLGPDTTFIHCNDLTDDELDLVAESGGTTSVSPYVEMLIGHGHPATGRLVEHGLRPSFSVDIVANGPGDMFTQMRAAFAADRLRSARPGEPFAPRLTHRDILEFATIEGARACGLDHKVGSLRVGKEADVVLLRASAINTAPLIDPAGTVVGSADTSNIDSVFVAGRALKRDGRLSGAPTVASVVHRLEASRDYLLRRADMVPTWQRNAAHAH